MHRAPSSLTTLVLLLTAAACGGSGSPAATAYFDLDADLSARASFFDLPFPGDFRLRADGTPDLTGYPIRDTTLFIAMRDIAMARPGWPVMPVGYVRFDGELGARSRDDLIAADAASPVLLVDVDPASPEHGKLFPTVAQTLPFDDYAPPHLLALAPRPGIVLVPGRRYAYVVRRGLGDAAGKPLGVPRALADLAAGKTPAGAHAAAIAADLAPVWPTLDSLGVPRDDVAAAMAFTPGDVVADTKALGDKVLGADHALVQITDLHLDPDDGATHPRFCELQGTLAMPNFQKGDEPYNTDGQFVLAADGTPEVQKTLALPMVITIPKAPMPAAGYPLVLYFHGSGGLHDQVVDRGKVSVLGGPEAKGEGPSHVLAPHGFATAGTALPVNPERVPGATDIAYINFGNLAAFPFTFREGVLEQRLFLNALAELQIDPAALAACAGPSLPAGATAYHFDADSLFGMGQSMGGMYTNLIGATEPRLEALVPTGAGGYWPFMVLQSSLFADLTGFLPVLLDTNAELHFMHPGLHLLELAWEPAEPLAYMPRIARRPLPGVQPRSIYEPVGQGDHYFSTLVYDAVALAYGHEQAGDVIWPTMQDALMLEGLGGVRAYPVLDNLTSEGGAPYTGVVVQYAGDGLNDPHDIFQQLDAVKYQYACFLETADRSATGKAIVAAPMPIDSPCPEAP